MMQKFGRFLFLIVLLALFFGTSKATGIYVDWLFFREVGFEKVFTKVMSTQVTTGLAFGLRSVSWKVFRAIMLAWVVTLPFCALTGAALYFLLNVVF